MGESFMPESEFKAMLARLDAKITAKNGSSQIENPSENVAPTETPATPETRPNEETKERPTRDEIKTLAVNYVKNWTSGRPQSVGDIVHAWKKYSQGIPLKPSENGIEEGIREYLPNFTREDVGTFVDDIYKIAAEKNVSWIVEYVDYGDEEDEDDEM